MRGGPPCFPTLGGYRSSTLQLPTTQPCLEELLTQGRGEPEACADEVLRQPEGEGGARVLALHAEVEGGRHNAFLKTLLRALADEGAPVITLAELARRTLRTRESIPVVEATLTPLPGRGGRVFAPAALAGQRA
jgi:hypothetical protein